MSRKCTVSADSISAKPEREDQLHQHDDREQRQLAAVERPLVVDQEPSQDRQPEEEVDHVRQHA